MANAFYAKMATVARNLLLKFGDTVTITRTTGKVIDPVDGTITPGTTAVHSPKGVLVSYKTNDIDGTLIRAGDKCFVLDDTIEPIGDDTITTDSGLWNVIDVKVVKPDDSTGVVYFVQVRK